MNAKDEILARVRQAVTGAPEVEIPRAYRQRAEPADLIGLLAERIADYRATVHVVPAGEVPATLTRLAAGRRLAAPGRLPQPWLDALPEPETGELPVAELDKLDGVVTGCAVAIAETGTIVLDERQGRRAATLVPDYHLCVIEAAHVVATVPEAVARLDPTGPLTWISGPSATSDIELDRVEGVHGPRTLEVVIAI
ncbi:lactate utilization protein C [Nonomuraea sp. NPDC050328]|uniref:lactate utilization protein C n=1 Tax=Nonomuraea sp. NPDC050328 TaxID=3364361 RepID=UPI00379A7CE2